MTTKQAVSLVRKAIGDPTGKCYYSSEVVKFLANENLTPHFIRTGPLSTHWYLVDRRGRIIDPTVHQFTRLPNYSVGRGCGFRGKDLSKRAQKLLDRIKGEHVSTTA